MMRAEKRMVETRAVQQVRSAVNMAVRVGFPVLVVGDAGLGKTTALKFIKPEFDAAYCEVTQQTKSLKGMYRMVIDAFEIQTDVRFTYDLCDVLLNNLKREHYQQAAPPLFVDEYQTFEPRVLRELLAIHERCRFPLVLAGNQERLARTAKDAGALEQIESRIGMRVRIGAPTPEDFASIGVEYNLEGPEAYEAIKNYGCRTSLREVRDLLDVCLADTNRIGSIRLSHLKAALMALTSSHDALRLFNPAIAA